MEIQYLVGKTYYTQDGAAVCLEAITTGGAFVVRQWLTYDGPESTEEVQGDARIVERLWEKAPTERVDTEFAAKSVELASIRQQIADARADLRAATRERDDLVKRLSDVPVLRRIDDYLAGRITHVVVWSQYSVEIKTIDEALDCRDWDDIRRNRPMEPRLVCLFGGKTSDGKARVVTWEIARYPDGSGRWLSSILCCSEEEARAVAAEKLPAIFDAARNSANDYTFTQAIASAKAAGVEPPVDMVEQLAAWQQAGLASAVEAKKAELAKAEQALAEAIANSKVHA